MGAVAQRPSKALSKVLHQYTFRIIMEAIESLRVVGTALHVYNAPTAGCSQAHLIALVSFKS